MNKTHLDDTGLSYLWSKIKTYIDNAISTVVNIYSSFGNSVILSDGTINLTHGDVFIKTISSNTTFTFTGVPSGKTATFSMILINGGAYTITWPSSVKWSYGSEPILTSNGTDVLTFLTSDGGTTWYGSLSMAEVS